MNDQPFNPLAKPFIGKTVVLADYGFRDTDGGSREYAELQEKHLERMDMCRNGFVVGHGDL